MIHSHPLATERTDTTCCWYPASNPLPTLLPTPWHTPWQQRQVLTINSIRCIPNCHCQGVNTNHYPVIATPNMTYHTYCKAFPHASVFWEAHQQADKGIIEILFKGHTPYFYSQREKKVNIFEKKHRNALPIQKKAIPLHRNWETDALLAQLVEQLTLNQWVQGSSPWGCTSKREILKSVSLFDLYLSSSRIVYSLFARFSHLYAKRLGTHARWE